MTNLHELINKTQTYLSYFRSDDSNLKNRNVKSTAYLVAQAVIENALKFISSLILTRIFLPEVYGTLTILYATITGIHLLLDIGSRSYVVQHHNGKDKNLLDTIWILNIARGVIVYFFIFMLSGQFENLFGIDDLSLYLQIMGISVLITSFTSVNTLVLAKEIKQAQLVKLQLTARVFEIVVTVILALITESIWAFIISNIIATLLYVILSYLISGKHLPRIYYHHRTALSVLSFSKWIFVSSILTYLVNDGERFFLGILLQPSNLGLYHLANMYASIPVLAIASLASHIIFPSVSELVNNGQSYDSYLSKFIYGILLLGGLLSIFFSVFGLYIIDMLYTQDYSKAGQYLQILSISIVAKLVALTLITVLLAHGNSISHMKFYALWALSKYILIYLGMVFYGEIGAIIGVTISSFLVLPIAYIISRKYLNIQLIKVSGLLLPTCMLIFVCWYYSGFISSIHSLI